jgi:hypothetical protein
MENVRTLKKLPQKSWHLVCTCWKKVEQYGMEKVPENKNLICRLGQK